MKISIITPVYNAVSSIEKTILSVIKQEITSELEYIIIDGGSNDGTLEVIHRYADKIGILISEKDNGIYDAMNKGISRATGDIIGIINADDWYNDKALQVIENLFLKESKVDIIYSSLHNYFNGQYLNTFIPGDLDNLLFKFTLNHPGCFVKKTVYEKIGLFDLNYLIAADYDFIFRAYIYGFCFHYVETPLASYSLNGFTGQSWNKFMEISESWRVASSFAKKTSKDLVSKRQRFYLVWIAKELLTFVPKQFIKPSIARCIKDKFRKAIGNLPSDQYGVW
ncbi:glycosyltransferase family 2 protein [Chlorogloeopsis sp. ULAP01]|uniref:glycosyltransferase family 2 protein n=1 Tax=Chlorogloeopsis sp. ULAP01 TaxID=3056483 RepID=UPI0025AB53DE|nr:glycosyltransferase family 2 protein [Chlorogloeopsis sp. ULAP01]MDM9381790.1 glycosyltransferase family 2 protein [Chlorogloeopsis sp. ULAP01]